MNAALGKHLPLAVTEWNYSWKPGQTPQNDPYMATFTQQSLQAMAQAGIVLANQFDIASNAGGSSLDMVHPQDGQGTPQLQAMHDVIQHYQTGTNDLATGTIPPSETLPSPGITPTLSGTTGATNTGMLLSAQQVTCPSTLQSVGTTIAVAPTQTVTTIKPSATSTPSATPSANPSATSSPGNECTFLTKVTGSGNVQHLLLTWWNEGATLPNEVQIAISGDSSDGINGTWTSWPSTLATGGFQLLSVPGQTHWIKVHLTTPIASTGPVIGIVEVYALASPTPPDDDPTVTPTPSLPATPTNTPAPTNTPPVAIASHP